MEQTLWPLDTRAGPWRGWGLGNLGGLILPFFLRGTFQKADLRAWSCSPKRLNTA